MGRDVRALGGYTSCREIVRQRRVGDGTVASPCQCRVLVLDERNKGSECVSSQAGRGVGITEDEDARGVVLFWSGEWWMRALKSLVGVSKCPISESHWKLHAPFFPH
jgi:hypothetical protein